MKGRSTQYRILNMMIITSYIKNQNYLKRKLLQKAIKTGFTAKNERIENKLNVWKKPINAFYL